MWYVIGFASMLIVVWLLAIKLFPHTVTVKEGLIMLGVQTCVIATVVFGSLYGQGSDVQILNGMVTGKKQEKVSCEHSYQCNCYTSCSGSGSNRSCTRICQTCYEHSYDFDWRVYSNVGELNINRVDRQGTEEPQRWSIVQLGEPFATQSSYYNYIKASPFSIFNKTELDKTTPVPAYLQVHDYYRINRVIDYGSPFKHNQDLNNMLNESLKKLGPSKKVNIVVILHNKGAVFAETVKTKHLGGKINDLYVVIDIDKEGVFNSVAAFSWSKSDLVNVAVRDALLDIGKYDAVKMNEVISTNVQQHYQHRSTEEFKYLEEDVEIPKWALWFVMIFGILFPFGATWVAHKHEIA